VVDVVPDGPAARAGVRKFDVIGAIQSEEVGSVEALRARLKQIGVGERVGLRVYRSGQEGILQVTIAEAPEEGLLSRKP
jgi:S1-C subfamily serine protease